MLYQKIISIVIPVFNEEESLEALFARLSMLNSLFPNDVNCEFIFINDGSTDNSLKIIKKQALNNNNIKIISFSRNFGHQMAITAGLQNANGEFVSIIDSDLQDPPEIIPQMYQLAVSKKIDIVYGKRRKRPNETFFKKLSAKLFYRFINYLSDIDIPKDTGDFRIISRKVVDDFNKMPEQHRFIRGMIPWLGYKSTPFEYDRGTRDFGKTKFPINKMIEFATNAIFSFSRKPLKLAIKLGLFLIIVGSGFGLYMLYLKLFTNIPVAGITSIILLITYFSGFQIILIGIIGDYIGRIFDEVKSRPLYVIDEKINFDENKSN